MGLERGEEINSGETSWFLDVPPDPKVLEDVRAKVFFEECVARGQFETGKKIYDALPHLRSQFEEIVFHYAWSEVIHIPSEDTQEAVSILKFLRDIIDVFPEIAKQRWVEIVASIPIDISPCSSFTQRGFRRYLPQVLFADILALQSGDEADDNDSDTKDFLYESIMTALKDRVRHGRKFTRQRVILWCVRCDQRTKQAIIEYAKKKFRWFILKYLTDKKGGKFNSLFSMRAIIRNFTHPDIITADEFREMINEACSATPGSFSNELKKNLMQLVTEVERSTD